MGTINRTYRLTFSHKVDEDGVQYVGNSLHDVQPNGVIFVHAKTLPY
jgi:hypothetical protein